MRENLRRCKKLTAGGCFIAWVSLVILAQLVIPAEAGIHFFRHSERSRGIYSKIVIAKEPKATAAISTLSPRLAPVEAQPKSAEVGYRGFLTRRPCGGPKEDKNKPLQLGRK